MTFVVMFAGSLLQGYSGFGFGLLVLPLLLFLNFDFPAAVVMVIVGSAVQKIIGVRYFRRYFKWIELKPLFILGVIGLPIGVFFLYKASFLGRDTVKQIIGFVILAALVLRWTGLAGKNKNIKEKWGYIAGFFSGILNGFANIGGPPIVLWVLSHNWKNEKMRVMVIALSLTFVPFQLGIMSFVFGKRMIMPILYSLAMIPSILIGTWIGLKLGDKLTEKRLIRFMETLLLVIAVLAIVKPFFK